jgi:hypothetical protein
MENNNIDAQASLETSTPLGYYKWYPRDFLASSTVRKMSLTAQGVYRALLDVQWEDGAVPADYDEACLIIRANQQEAESFRPFFQKCFPDGLNAKLDEQRAQSILHILEQKRRGKAGAEKKARLKDEADVEPPLSHRLTTAEPPLNECLTTAEPPLSPTTTTTTTTTETTTIKVKKDADAPSSRKGKVDYHSLAQEAGFEDDMFLKAWNEFVEHRREIKHPMSERAANLILAKLKKFSVEIGVEAINRSISSGWRDVFPEKASQRVGVKGRPSRMGSALEYMASNRDNVQEPEYFNAEFKEIILKRQKALEGK